jgi:hypothetical protein
MIDEVEREYFTEIRAGDEGTRIFIIDVNDAENIERLIVRLVELQDVIAELYFRVNPSNP